MGFNYVIELENKIVGFANKDLFYVTKKKFAA